MLERQELPIISTYLVVTKASKLSSFILHKGLLLFGRSLFQVWPPGVSQLITEKLLVNNQSHHFLKLLIHDGETTHLKQKTIKLWRNLLEVLRYNFRAHYFEKYMLGKNTAYKNLCDHLSRKTTSRWR